MDEVAQVKERLDVAEVVGSYIQLKQAGRNLKAVCPFHQEKTGSFMVSPEKGIWHCFGCGEGGDIFKFVMMIEGLEFKQALEILARRAGVELKSRPGQRGQTKIRDRLYAALDLAAKYYQQSLIKNPKALKYVAGRGFKRESVRQFRIGYAADTWEGLTKFLAKQGFSADELLKAGLAGQKAGRSKVYDYFRGRIMLPIADPTGRVVGFTGRVLDDSEPKYLNTPQTLLYDKSRAIYGLDLAREAIRESDQAVMVEGNLDVISSHQSAVRQVVAVSGTALTGDQLKALGRLAKSKQVLLCLDQDSAGLAATLRAIELSQKLGITLKVIELPEGVKDPDELIKARPDDWPKAISAAKYVVDYLFDRFGREVDLTTELGRKGYSDRLAPVLFRLADPAEQDRYIQKLAEAIGSSVEATRQKVTSGETETPINSRLIAVKPATAATKRSDGRSDLEELALAMALAYPETRAAMDELAAEDLSAPERQAIWAELQLTEGLPKASDYVNILTLRGEQEYADLAPADRSFEAFKLMRRLQTKSSQNTKEKLSQELRAAEAAGDQHLAKSLLAKYQALITEEL